MNFLLYDKSFVGRFVVVLVERQLSVEDLCKNPDGFLSPKGSHYTFVDLKREI